MKKIFFVIIAMIVVSTSFISCERIDAGCEGILVNLYGSDKGIDDVSLCTGRVWYNPFTQSVYEYPTYVQTIDYPEFTINAKDGAEFTIDPTISLKIVDGKSPFVFRKYRKELSDVIEGTLFNYVKDAFRIELNSYTTDEIVSKRAEVEMSIEKHLSEALEKECFQLEQLTSGLKYPKMIVDAVNAKTRATQEAAKAQNELAVAKAEAEKKIVTAQAEAEVNRLRQSTLTPLILQEKWIAKWNGVLPQYMPSNSTGMLFSINEK